MSETPSSATPLPTGIQLTSLDPAFREDPHAILDRLRAEDPVHYNALLDSYLLTRYDDVFAVLRDRELRVDPRTSVSNSPISQMRNARLEEGIEPSMLMLDAPEHDRLRNLVNKAFTPRAVDRMAPRIQQVSDELLDRAIPRGAFDVIADFSAPLPTIIIAEMLGVDPEDQAQFKIWSDTIVQGFNPPSSIEPFFLDFGRVILIFRS
jgi:cytochrome P450